MSLEVGVPEVKSVVRDATIAAVVMPSARGALARQASPARSARRLAVVRMSAFSLTAGPAAATENLRETAMGEAEGEVPGAGDGAMLAATLPEADICCVLDADELAEIEDDAV